MIRRQVVNQADEATQEHRCKDAVGFLAWIYSNADDVHVVEEIGKAKIALAGVLRLLGFNDICVGRDEGGEEPSALQEWLDLKNKLVQSDK